jgi:hypothetical protein
VNTPPPAGGAISGQDYDCQDPGFCVGAYSLLRVRNGITPAMKNKPRKDKFMHRKQLTIFFIMLAYLLCALL